jgi:hypothetical protein
LEGVVLVAAVILALVYAYAACGLLFGVAFVSAGAGRLDPAARGASIAFRLVILPGAALLWPLLLGKWLWCIRQKGAR